MLTFGRPVASNNAFERPVKRCTSARGQRAIHFALSARLKAALHGLKRPPFGSARCHSIRVRYR